MWLAVAAAVAPVVPGEVQEAPLHYVVRSGDTLFQLARRYLAAGHDWRTLGKLWHVRNPRRLPVGRTFTIPRAWLRWTADDARVVGLRGTVSLQAGGRPLRPAVGIVLPEGASVSTAANSFVTLALTNGSRIALPSQSEVTILRLRKYAINNTIEYRFRLDRGALDTKDTPFHDPDGEFSVRTPLALTAVRGTEFAVSFDPAKAQSGTAVYEGTVAVSGSDGARAQLVSERFGAVTAGNGPTVDLPLLPAPDLTDPGRVQADDVVTFDVGALPEATGYHAQLASDAGFVDTFAEQDSTTPHFAFADVPNGMQFVRISANGPGGLHGMRQSYAFSRHLASIKAQAEQTADGFVFRWFGNGEGDRHYRLQISRDAAPGGGTAFVDEVGLARNEAVVRKLPPGVYYWRVGVTQVDAEGTIDNWTTPEKLTITRPGR
jgi:hypothetical protein